MYHQVYFHPDSELENWLGKRNSSLLLESKLLFLVLLFHSENGFIDGHATRERKRRRYHSGEHENDEADNHEKNVEEHNAFE